MGRKLDALLGRTFKTSKFKTLVNLAISRLAVLKNQRQVRCTQARSDTSQLLNLGHQDRALLRVEQVIKEQNMLDVFVVIEGYCHVLIERVALLETNKTCPHELEEAASSLIYAASRCGEFPELAEIREIFVSKFGREFAARAVELRNSCRVNPKIVQKLSTRQPNLETRMKVLQEIASENGITLHREEEHSVTKEEKQEIDQKPNQPELNVSGSLGDPKPGNETDHLVEEINREEQLSGSTRARKRYSNVASAAQAAFESAAYAAEAARAALELSRSDSQDNFSDGQSSPASRRGNRPYNDGSSNSRLRDIGRNRSFGEVEESNGGFIYDEIHPINNSDSEGNNSGSELEGGLPQVHDKVHLKDFKKKEIYQNLERSRSSSSLDSVEDAQENKASSNVMEQNKTPEDTTLDSVENMQDHKISSNALGQNEPFDKISFDESDDENVYEQDTINEFPKIRKPDPEVKDTLKRLSLGRRPISVRTRRGNEY